MILSAVLFSFACKYLLNLNFQDILHGDVFQNYIIIAAYAVQLDLK